MSHIEVLSSERGKGVEVHTKFLDLDLGCTYVWIFLLYHILRLSVLRGGRGLDVATKF